MKKYLQIIVSFLFGSQTKWKSEWDSKDGNLFLELFSFKDNYVGAIIFHLLYAIFLFLAWHFVLYFYANYVDEFIYDIFDYLLELGISETIGKRFISLITAWFWVYILIILYRFIYFARRIE